MFKIVENPDGSTTVYSKTNGRFICTVPQKQSSLKPVAIGHPMPRPSLLDGSRKSSEIPPPKASKKVLTMASPSSSSSKLKLKPEKEDISPDYSEDCITREQFLQAIGLVGKEKMKTTPIEELKLDFPYRSVSKTDWKSFEPDVRFFDKVSFSTERSQRLMKYKHLSMKFLMTSERIEASRKKIEHSCKCAIFSPLHFESTPNLRHRENKYYPVTYVEEKPQISQHQYCFNRQQKLERRIVLRTGLCKRSRQMEKRCQKLSVVIKKLSTKEIEKLKAAQRKRPPKKMLTVQTFFKKRSFGKTFRTNIHRHPGILYIIKKHPQYSSFLSQFQISSCTATTPAVSSKKETSTTNSYVPYRAILTRKKTKDIHNSRVMVHNVLQDLIQGMKGCYVKNTSIWVKGFHILPLVAFSVEAMANNTSDHDHSYCRLTSAATPASSSVSQDSHQQAPSHVNLFRKQERFPVPAVKQAQPNFTPPALFRDTRNITIPTKSPMASLGPHVALPRFPFSSNLPRSSSPTPKLVPSSAIHPARLIPLQQNRPLPQLMAPIPKSLMRLKPETKVPVEKRSNGVTVIDLCSDDEEESEQPLVVQQQKAIPSYLPCAFHCYGCSSRSVFANKAEASTKIKNHLIEYHSVLQPELFLEYAHDMDNQTVHIVAFPGYKTCENA